jgi:hypothetical protein
VSLFTNCDWHRTRDLSDITNTRPTTAAAWIDRFLSLAAFYISRGGFDMLDACDYGLATRAFCLITTNKSLQPSVQDHPYIICQTIKGLRTCNT